MEAKLVVLKLFLDELGIPASIESVDDRKRVQKAVYLGQLTGVDLGYRFGWYLMGPYSPVLTRDYYRLADDLASGDKDADGKVLQPEVRKRLHAVSPMLETPHGFSPSQEDWLELLASVHYLRKVRRLDESQAEDVLKKEKPLLCPWMHAAIDALTKTSLLG